MRMPPVLCAHMGRAGQQPPPRPGSQRPRPMTSPCLRPGLTLRMTPAPLITSQRFYGSLKEVTTPRLGAGQSSRPPKHSAFLTCFEFLPPGLGDHSGPICGTDVWGTLREPLKKSSLYFVGSQCPPKKAIPSSSACSRLWGQDRRLATMAQAAWRQGRKVPGPAGGQRGPGPSLLSSPRTHHVEMKTPSSRKLMKTVFMRQLFSGVNFAQRPASRGKLERSPHPGPSSTSK